MDSKKENQIIDNIYIKAYEMKLKYLDNILKQYNKKPKINKKKIEKIEEEKYKLYNKISDELDFIYNK